MKTYDIPQRWQIVKLRQILQPFSEKKHPELPLLSVVREKGVIIRNTESKEENHNYIPEDLSGYKRVKIGQFAMNKMKAWQGSYGISKYNGIVSPAYFVFDVITKVNLDFFNFAIRSKVYVNYFGRASDGIRVGQWDLSINRMKEIPFFLPPRDEQDQIVRFLDWKVSQINRLINNLKRYIDMLNLLKRNVIEEIIGQCNVSTVKLKHISFCNPDVLSESTNKDYEFKYIDIGSVDFENGITQYQKICFGNAPSRARKIVKKNDIIVSTVRTYLRAVAQIIDDDNVIVSTGFAVIRPKSDLIDSKFIEYYCKSDTFCNEVIRLSNGIAYPAINTSALINIKIPYPPIYKQKVLSESVENKCKNIDHIIHLQKDKISLLYELKTV